METRGFSRVRIGLPIITSARSDARWGGVRALVELHVHRTVGGDAGQRLQRATGDPFVAHAGRPRAVQGRAFEAESAAGSTYADTSGIRVIDYNIVDGNWQHTQAHTEQTAGGSASMLAPDNFALPADRAGTGIRSDFASTANAAVGANTTDYATQHQRRSAECERETGAVRAL